MPGWSMRESAPPATSAADAINAASDPRILRNAGETLALRRTEWKREPAAIVLYDDSRPTARMYRARPTATSRSGSSHGVISTSAVASVRPAVRQRPTTR